MIVEKMPVLSFKTVLKRTEPRPRCRRRTRVQAVGQCLQFFVARLQKTESPVSVTRILLLTENPPGKQERQQEKRESRMRAKRPTKQDPHARNLPQPLARSRLDNHPHFRVFHFAA
jgi:hypothetical protein